MDSDSDKTIDSDELEELIACSKKGNLRSPNDKNNSQNLKRPVPSFKEVFGSESDEDNGGTSYKKGFESKSSNVCSDSKKAKLTTSSKPKCQYGKNCFRKNPYHLQQFDHSSDGNDACNISKQKLNKPKCSFGKNCYRKNPIHLAEYDHEGEYDSDGIIQHTSSNVPSSAEPSFYDCHFFLTKVTGIPEKYNKTALDIRDILSLKDGNLVSSAQFNYMFDIPWLMEQYPVIKRQCPLTIIHGEQRESKKTLEQSGSDFPHIKFCQAKLDIPYGTHHTKMMFLLYKEGFRIVIHTANMVDSDWYQRTQGIWVSPVLPKLKTDSHSGGESSTFFKADLLEYVSAYNGLEEWLQVIKEHDFSTIKVFLIGSVPGRHVGTRKTAFGHLKLRKILNRHGSSKDSVNVNWPIVGQFSSIGTLGPSPHQWLMSEFSTSLATTKDSGIVSESSSLKLVFPTEENVRKSLQGYPAGASLPYSFKVAQKQPYLKEFLHQWKSDRLGRSEASPHIKSYLRVSPDVESLAWFLVTSANLSKAAWGALEKKGSQFMIRSYELGVLFLPKFFDLDMFSTPKGSDNSRMFPVPYDLPLKRYSKDDEPWIWDIPHIRAPDRFGNMWCPP